jgi:CBS domain-containing protein
MMRVQDVMKKEVFSCPDTAMLADAAKVMWERDVGFVPIVSGSGILVGVLTDRDAVMAAWFRDEPLTRIEVRGVMSTGIVTCRPDAQVYEAERLMRRHQVHRLPVTTAEGRLAGVVSLNDLAIRATRESDSWLQEEVAETLSAISAPRSAP